MERRGRLSSRRYLAVALGIALVSGALLTAPAGATHGGPGECPPVMPTADVRDAMTGTGYTVSEGTTPEPFSVEVLGVLEDGIGPGRDMIVVRADSPAIERAGGIWFGMSGSPVYIDNKFVGAVAFGLSFGPSNVAGLTPAEDIVKVANRGEVAARIAPRRVQLDDATQRSIANDAGVSEDSVSTSMKRLKVPFSVSGAGAREFRKTARTIERENLPFVPYSGASSGTATPPAATERPEQGGNFAGAISYGDITLAGVGTTSYVCGEKVVAFGHPFFWSGKTSLGANLADALTIVDDPTFGPYKLATIEETLGTLDQDRFAGIRAILGAAPAGIPITSTVSANGDARDGETSVLDDQFLPFLTFIHLASNIDFTWDQIGPGSSSLSWTISGTTSTGEPWELSRSNLYSNEWDISYGSIDEIVGQLYRLYSNGFEEVSFTGIDVTAEVQDERREYKLSKVLVSTGGGEYLDKERVRVDPGTVIDLRVILEPLQGTEDRIVDLSVTVPPTSRYDASIEITGGGGGGYGDSFCFY
ncbi:MAG: SpoIVB peptidase S55 domain-containing protein, partial [Actinomycetota bacterium]